MHRSSQAQGRSPDTPPLGVQVNAATVNRNALEARDRIFGPSDSFCLVEALKALDFEDRGYDPATDDPGWQYLHDDIYDALDRLTPNELSADELFEALSRARDGDSSTEFLLILAERMRTDCRIAKVISSATGVQVEPLIKRLFQMVGLNKALGVRERIEACDAVLYNRASAAATTRLADKTKKKLYSSYDAG